MTVEGMGTPPVAQLRNVHKRFGRAQALRGVDLDICPGELVALLGPNGAGKTTAVSIVLGQRRPDSGSATLFGRDPTIPAARRSVEATPQETGFPNNLRVREVVDLVRAHYPDPTSTEEVLERFGLLDVAGRQTGGLSGGQKRRLAVALAFAALAISGVTGETRGGATDDGRRDEYGFITKGNHHETTSRNCWHNKRQYL